MKGVITWVVRRGEMEVESAEPERFKDMDMGEGWDSEIITRALDQTDLVVVVGKLDLIEYLVVVDADGEKLVGSVFIDALNEALLKMQESEPQAASL